MPITWCQKGILGQEKLAGIRDFLISPSIREPFASIDISF
jgi:hypothetical protein